MDSQHQFSWCICLHVYYGSWSICLCACSIYTCLHAWRDVLQINLEPCALNIYTLSYIKFPPQCLGGWWPWSIPISFSALRATLWSSMALRAWMSSSWISIPSIHLFLLIFVQSHLSLPPPVCYLSVLTHL